jgi:hypothetical protein
LLIVIGSAPGREDWLKDCSTSIDREHIAVVNTGFELAKIDWVINNTNAERFLFLQDTWIVKSPDFWVELEKHSGSIALNQDPYFYGCYAGVYERSVIERIGIPQITEKCEAIHYEIAWHKDYVKVAGEPIVLFPKLTDANSTRQVEKNGRTNLLLENDLIAKYKGTWC